MTEHEAEAITRCLDALADGSPEAADVAWCTEPDPADPAGGWRVWLDDGRRRYRIVVDEWPRFRVLRPVHPEQEREEQHA
jgi:hypothetical protein